MNLINSSLKDKQTTLFTNFVAKNHSAAVLFTFDVSVKKCISFR